MKKSGVIIGVTIVGFLLWYLAIKPYDFLVTFKVKANAGTINQTLKLWNNSLENHKPMVQENLKNLVQQIQTNDSVYTYHWAIHSLNDSISQVKVYVKDKNYSLQNKISIPFSNTDFEKTTTKTVRNFVEELKRHLKEIKIKLEGISKTKATYCAYVSVKAKQIEKAKGMMQNYGFLDSFIASNGIKTNGTPFIEVTNWDLENDLLEYNFCFPILKNDSLPKLENVKYKQLKSVKAIKAIYNGNYITSDRAWYALLDYANKNGVSVDKKPVEFFYNNPNMGGDALQWKTEVYLPIKN